MIDTLKQIWTGFVVPFFIKIGKIILNILESINNTIQRRFSWTWDDTWYLLFFTIVCTIVFFLFSVVFRSDSQNDFYLKHGNHGGGSNDYHVYQTITYWPDRVVFKSEDYDRAFFELQRIRQANGLPTEEITIPPSSEIYSKKVSDFSADLRLRKNEDGTFSILTPE